MKNLLPEQRKRSLIHAYVGRVGVVSLVFMIALLVISIVALLPSYLVAHMQQNTFEKTLAEAERQVAEGGGDVAQAFLEETGQLLVYAEATAQYPRATERMSLLQSDTTPGIRFDDLSVRVQDSGHVIANVQGEALTRTALVAYKDALERNPNIREVTLPLRDLAANQNIPFTITVEFESAAQ